MSYEYYFYETELSLMFQIMFTTRRQYKTSPCPENNKIYENKEDPQRINAIKIIFNAYIIILENNSNSKEAEPCLNIVKIILFDDIIR